MSVKLNSMCIRCIYPFSPSDFHVVKSCRHLFHSHWERLLSSFASLWFLVMFWPPLPPAGGLIPSVRTPWGQGLWNILAILLCFELSYENQGKAWGGGGKRLCWGQGKAHWAQVDLAPAMVPVIANMIGIEPLNMYRLLSVICGQCELCCLSLIYSVAELFFSRRLA